MVSNSRKIILSAVLAAIAFIYLFTMNPCFKNNDSPETSAAAYFLGIGHPPGYPLFSMAAKIFTYIPLGNVAFRVNFFSALLALLTLLITYRTTGIIAAYFRELDGAAGYCMRIFTLCALAFSMIFWEQAVEAKGGIYILNLLFTSLLIYIFLRLQERFHIKYVYMAGLVFGLSLANHWPSAMIMAPFCLYFVFIYHKRFGPGRIIFTLLFLFCGVSAYLYLPIRGHGAPPLNWGNPVSLSSMLWVILRKAYTAPVSPSFDVYLYQVLELIRIVAVNYSLLAVFCVAGFIAMFKRAKKQAVLLCAIFVLTVVLVVFVNLAKREIVYLLDIFLLPALYIMALFIAPGLTALSALKVPKYLSVSAAVIAFAAMSAFNFGINDLSRDYIAYDYGNNILASMNNGSIYIADADHNAMPVYYIQEVEKKRADIKLAVASFLAFDWGIEDFRRRTGIDADMTPHNGGGNIRNLLAYGAKTYGAYRNYSGVEALNDIPGLYLHRRGLLEKTGGKDEKTSFWPFKLYSYRGIFGENNRLNRSDASLLTWYPVTMVNCAVALLNEGDFLDSAELNRMALSFPVDEPRANICYDISMAYFRMNDTVNEMRYLKEAVGLKTTILPVYERLGLLYYNMGLLDRALEVFAAMKAMGGSSESVDRALQIISGFSAGDRLELALMKGNEKLLKNDYVSAREIFDFLIEKGYKNDIIFKNLGVFHFKTGNYKQAIEDFRKSENETHNAAIVLYLAMTFEKLGEYKEAATELESGIKDFSGDKALFAAFRSLKERSKDGKSTDSIDGQGRGDKDKQRP
jgi:tetratricopeptide (TPR) repeat protein